MKSALPFEKSWTGIKQWKNLSMDNNKQLDPLSKRIRRHLTGRTRDFFAATSPGFEKLCMDELSRLRLSTQEITAVKGGVEFKGRLHDCYLANLNLRTASRVLMRLGEVKASSFRRLEKFLADFPWEIYLFPKEPLEFSVSVSQCRLYHQSAIAQRFAESISRRFTGAEFQDAGASGFGQKIFVRGLDDQFSFSLDTSGELLYKRGIKTHGGKAPVRETLAAAILKMVGYTGKEPLIDPMCGSGTFSIEAALMAARIPPGSRRNFAFMGWPAFSPGRWNYLKKEAEKHRIKKGLPKIFASDLDPEACAALEQGLSNNGLDNIISVACRDFFSFSSRDITSQRGLVVLNPPYGLRMGDGSQSIDFINDIIVHLRRHYKGWKAALIIPETASGAKLPLSLTAHPLIHGGRNCLLFMGRIL
jgi:putative N6-adenine-specific DNA methylase